MPDTPLKRFPWESHENNRVSKSRLGRRRCIPQGETGEPQGSRRSPAPATQLTYEQPGGAPLVASDPAPTGTSRALWMRILPTTSKWLPIRRRNPVGASNWSATFYVNPDAQGANSATRGSFNDRRNRCRAGEPVGKLEGSGLPAVVTPDCGFVTPFHLRCGTMTRDAFS